MILNIKTHPFLERNGYEITTRTYQKDEKVANAEEDLGGLGKDKMLLDIWTGKVNPATRNIFSFRKSYLL